MARAMVSPPTTAVSRVDFLLLKQAVTTISDSISILSDRPQAYIIFVICAPRTRFVGYFLPHTKMRKSRQNGLCVKTA